MPRLLDGELAGIAVTERHGGSRIREIATEAVPAPGDGLLLRGQKTWVSRLHEAAVFVVHFRDPAGQLAAVIVDAGLLASGVPPSRPQA